MIELLFLFVFAICFILLLRKYVPIWQIIIAELYLATFFTIPSIFRRGTPLLRSD